MANKKFSQFTAGAAYNPTNDGLGRIAGFTTGTTVNNIWTPDEIALGLSLVTATPYSIYAANGNISADRTVTIDNSGNVPYSVNFKGNSGAAGAGPVFLQIENERVDAAYSTNSGAQLRLKGGSSSGSLNTDLEIIAHGSNFGGTSAPQVHFNSNRGYTFTAGAGGSSINNGVSQDFVLKAGSTGQIIASATTNFGNNTNTTIAMIGGGGSSASMIQMGKSGNDIGKFIRSTHNGTLQIGKHSGGAYGTAGTTTTEIYVDASSNVGIGDNTTLTEKLHVSGNAVITGQAYTELHTGADIDDVDWNNSNVQEITLPAGTTDFTPSNPKAGATYILKLTQPGTADGLVNWDAIGASNIKWPGGTEPTLTASAGAIDIITLICTDATGAGVYYASATLNMQ